MVKIASKSYSIFLRINPMAMCLLASLITNGLKNFDLSIILWLWLSIYQFSMQNIRVSLVFYVVLIQSMKVEWIDCLIFDTSNFTASSYLNFHLCFLFERFKQSSIMLYRKLNELLKWPRVNRCNSFYIFIEL